MKRLTLIRHAKSDWSSGAAGDHERPLNDRGRRDAPEMGRRLLDRSIGFDLVLASDARRARETIEAIRSAMGAAAGKLLVEPALYLAGPERLLALVTGQDAAVGHLALVGHNPGLSELAQQLGAAVDDLPTCGIVTFEFPEMKSWKELSGPSAARVMIDLPKRKWVG